MIESVEVCPSGLRRQQEEERKSKNGHQGHQPFAQSNLALGNQRDTAPRILAFMTHFLKGKMMQIGLRGIGSSSGVRWRGHTRGEAEKDPQSLILSKWDAQVTVRYDGM